MDSTNSPSSFERHHDRNTELLLSPGERSEAHERGRRRTPSVQQRLSVGQGSDSINVGASMDSDEALFEEMLNAAAPNAQDQRVRMKAAVITQWSFVSLFVGLLVMVLILAPPWKYPECDVFQTCWSLVWVSLILIHMLLLVSMSHIRWSGSRPPRLMFTIQRMLRSTMFYKWPRVSPFGECADTIWFFVGVKPLYWDRVCDEFSIRLARSLWWLQATFFLVPLFCYLLICLCLPCIIIIINRMRTPSANELPTPEWILNKLEIKKYNDVIESIRNEYGPHVEFSSSAQILTEALTSNPIVEALTSAVGNTGAPIDHLTNGTPDRSPLLNINQQGVRLKVEKSCPICMADFDLSDDVMVMPCDKRHFFHIDCVKTWLKNSQFCPICRANIVTLIDPNQTSNHHRLPSTNNTSRRSSTERRNPTTNSSPPTDHLGHTTTSNIELNHSTSPVDFSPV